MMRRLDDDEIDLMMMSRLDDDEIDLMRVMIVYLSTLNSADKEIFFILSYIVSSNRLDKIRRTSIRGLG